MPTWFWAIFAVISLLIIAWIVAVYALAKLFNEPRTALERERKWRQWGRQ